MGIRKPCRRWQAWKKGRCQQAWSGCIDWRMENQWQQIAQILQKTLETGIHKVWISPLAGKASGRTVTLEAASRYVADWINARLARDIRNAAAVVLACEPDEIRLEIKVGKSGAVTGKASLKKPARNQQAQNLQDQHGQQDVADKGRSASQGGQAGFRPGWHGAEQAILPLGLPGLCKPRQWRYRFDDFVVGPCNRMAVAAAQDVCRQGSDVQTLFVNSGPGLGKTHLAQAVGQLMGKVDGSARVGYFTAEEFAGRYVASVRRQDVENFKSRIMSLDVLLLEDIHFFQGKQKMQDMALTVVKGLEEKGSRVMFTSSFSPRELQHVDSQLVSYFCSGIMASMNRPDCEMRQNIIRSKAAKLAVELPERVCDLLAERLDTDVRQLESCISSLAFQARTMGHKISAEMALDVLAQYVVAGGRPDLSLLTRLVCESYGLDAERLGSSSRRNDCVIGRNTIYYLARKHTELSLEEIGKAFNRRHSTVIKGITAVERELSRKSVLGRQIERTVSIIERQAGL